MSELDEPADPPEFYVDRQETIFLGADVRPFKLSRLPQTSGSVDTVIDFCVVAQSLEAPARLEIRREIFRVLRPGGAHVISYVNRLCCHDEAFPDQHHYTPLEIADELREAGFVIIRHTYGQLHSGLLARKPMQ